MTKQEKIDIIQQGIRETAICRCQFTYDPYRTYYYPNAVNDRFLLGQVEDDFCLDGYCVRKLSLLKKVEISSNKCNAINKMFGITDGVCMPDVDISSWQTIFQSLKQMDTYIQIEDAIHEQFAIGVIEKVLKNKLYFRHFDADGSWEEEELIIPYSQITSVQWGNRYAEYWKRYFENT